MINGKIQQEDISFVNIYAPNIGATKYIKHILTYLKEEVESNAITLGETLFNISLTSMDTSSRQKTNLKKSPLDDTIRVAELNR